MSENGARLTGRWLVAKTREGEARYSLIVNETDRAFTSRIDGEPTRFVCYMSPSGIYRHTTARAIQDLVELGKAVLA